MGVSRRFYHRRWEPIATSLMVFVRRRNVGSSCKRVASEPLLTRVASSSLFDVHPRLTVAPTFKNAAHSRKPFCGGSVERVAGDNRSSRVLRITGIPLPPLRNISNRARFYAVHFVSRYYSQILRKLFSLVVVSRAFLSLRARVCVTVHLCKISSYFSSFTLYFVRSNFEETSFCVY